MPHGKKPPDQSVPVVVVLSRPQANISPPAQRTVAATLGIPATWEAIISEPVAVIPIAAGKNPGGLDVTSGFQAQTVDAA